MRKIVQKIGVSEFLMININDEFIGAIEERRARRNNFSA